MLFCVQFECDDVYRSCSFFFFQAEAGIRYLVRSRGLGDVYKRQDLRGARLVGCTTAGADLDGAEL